MKNDFSVVVLRLALRKKSMHWTWLHVEKATGRCTICNTTVKSANPTNNATHLAAKHKITEAHEATQAKKEEAERQAAPKISFALAAVEKERRFLDYMLFFAVPFSRCQSDVFREEHPTSPKDPRTLRERLCVRSAALRGDALKHLAGRCGTLQVDAGTVWKKYMSIVLLCYGKRPLLINLPSADSMPSDFIEEQIAQSIQLLKKNAIEVIACTADNGSNFQKAIRNKDVLAQRCLAHSIQLAVNDAFALPRLSSVLS